MKTSVGKRLVEILVVEDSPTQAEQLQYILEEHGYSLVVARNGLEALAAIEQRTPTLVVSDVVMPQMDGYQLCRRIKNTDHLRHLPVILLTSLSDPADVVSGLECGADSFIFKPYDEQYLLDRISCILANRHLRENETTQMGVEVFFAGRKFFITSDRLQILNLLLSTYEAAVHKNRELTTAQDELRHLNEHLENKVGERTAALTAQIAAGEQTQSELQAQLHRLDLLHRIARAVGERQDLKSIFQVVITSLEDNLPIDFGCICLYEPATEVFSVASVGVKSEALAKELSLTERGIPIDSNGLFRCVRGQLIHEADASKSKFPFSQRLAGNGMHSLVVAPLLAERKIFGALIAARRQAGSFSTADCEFLQHLSEHVAVATHQAQLHSDLQQAYGNLRSSQHTIMEQERLRALGQMASGVAHDINNTISPVALYAESLLEQEPNLSDRARQYLTTIQRATEDVAQTVARMREFYRPRELQLVLTRIDLNELVQQVIDLTRVRWRDVPQERGIVVSLQTDLAIDLPSIMGADSEIRNALTNLVFNAIDSMPEGGTIMLRTKVVASQEHDYQSRSIRFVHVEVCDSGVGMDEDTRRRCLEPFFTTKGERGTGLGLATVYGMVQRHGAELEIDSVPDKGTTVRLIFPIPETLAATARVPVLRLPTQSMRILLVDDDPLVLESLKHTLENDGHFIAIADGGQVGIDAFAAAQSRGEPFAVVITDLGMPYMDGRKVAAAVKASAPGTPVILLTGWGQRLAADNTIPLHVDRVVSKPPKLHELRSVLAELAAGAG